MFFSEEERDRYEGEVKELLASYRYGLTLFKLVRLARSKLRLPAYRVYEIVRCLLQQGELSHHTGGFYTVKASSTLQKQTRNAAADRSSFSRVFSSEASPFEASRWAAFRMLLDHYIRCLEHGGKTSASAAPTGEGNSFCYLTLPEVPSSHAFWKHKEPLMDSDRLFVHLSGQTSGELILGYPVWVSKENKDEPDLYPVFCFPVLWEKCSEGIQLSMEKPKAFLNQKWFRYLRDRERQRLIELLKLSISSDGAVCEDFERLAGILEEVFPHSVCESLKCRYISHDTPDYSSEGLYNRAMLLKADRESDVSSLTEELRKIVKSANKDLDRTSLRFFFFTQKLVDLSLPSEGSMHNTIDGAVRSLCSNPLTTVFSNNEGKRIAAAEVLCQTKESLLLVAPSYKQIEAVNERSSGRIPPECIGRSTSRYADIVRSIRETEDLPPELRAQFSDFYSLQKAGGQDGAMNLLVKEALRYRPQMALNGFVGGSFLPLCPGMFDLVLIEGPEICSLPEAIPLLFRARRVGLLTFPGQQAFSPRLSPMTNEIESLLMEKADGEIAPRFRYAVNSLRDLAPVVPWYSKTAFTISAAAQKNKSGPYDTVWEERFAEALFEAGIKTEPQYQVGSYTLDLAIPEIRLDIEADGDVHYDSNGSRKSSDEYRDKQLESIGWKVMRFTNQQIKNDMKACVNMVMSYKGMQKLNE